MLSRKRQSEAAMDPFLKRRDSLARSLTDEGLDLLVVSNPVNVSYLTNFSGESSYLLVGQNRAVLLSDGRFTEQIAEECPGLETEIRPAAKLLQEVTGETMAKLGGRAVGFESAHLAVAEFEALKSAAPTVDWKGAKDRVERLRAIKDDTEIAAIREAIRFAERAFDMFRAMLQPDDNEKELCDALEMYVRRAGGRCTSFPSIVAVGARAALPHAPPSQHLVREAELLLVDWGASGRFYKSDLTRVLVPRKTSTLWQAEPKLREIYDVVLRAQQAALRVIRPHVKAGEVDAAAREVIKAAGYGDYFTHSTGHGLGMQVHEAPLMRPGSEAVLQAGMVVTVEPGIYVPQWGGVRIEDDVLVTPDGCTVLTHVPKDLSAMTVEW
jgi:Xaa-Pro aminopeptidase